MNRSFERVFFPESTIAGWAATFRAGVWYIAYPTSVDAIPRLQDWRSRKDPDVQALPSFNGKELRFEEDFWGVNQRIRRINASRIIIMDGDTTPLHARAKAFFDQLTLELRTKTAIIIPNENVRVLWPITAPPRVITWDELDTLLR